MRVVFQKTGRLVLVSALAISASASLSAQQDATEPNIVVNGTPIPDPATMPKGPEIKGIISARNDDRIKITTADGNSTVIAISEATKIKTSSGLFGGKSKLGTAALLNGLPVTVKTLQWSEGLLASHISFRKGDFKTANMIYNGTDQRFGEQAAATEALRGRMGDIDKYNIKGTTNVYFDTGKWALSAQAKDELCAAAAQADQPATLCCLLSAIPTQSAAKTITRCSVSAVRTVSSTICNRNAAGLRIAC